MKKILMVLVVMGASMMADAPLKSALGLSMDQAKAVDEIKAKFQKPYIAKRHDLTNEERWMRAARVKNNSKEVAERQKTVERLAAEFKAIQMAEDAEIRKVLTPEQNKKFDDYLKLRQEMKGASRDARYFN
jgi:Spy/CpxP family protein refolding chaperone